MLLRRQPAAHGRRACLRISVSLPAWTPSTGRRRHLADLGAEQRPDAGRAANAVRPPIRDHRLARPLRGAASLRPVEGRFTTARDGRADAGGDPLLSQVAAERHRGIGVAARRVEVDRQLARGMALEEGCARPAAPASNFPRRRSIRCTLRRRHWVRLWPDRDGAAPSDWRTLFLCRRFRRFWLRAGIGRAGKHQGRDNHRQPTRHEPPQIHHPRLSG